MRRSARTRSSTGFGSARVARAATSRLPSADALSLPADIFVVNQHRKLPSEWWTGAFTAAITAIGHTLLVLQPWSEPVPLTRSWCLWEVFSVIEAGKELSVVLSPRELESLNETLVRVGHCRRACALC